MAKKKTRHSRGSVLLETVLALFIMTTVGLVLVAMVQKAMIVTFKAREQTSCSRAVQTGFARLKNVDFYQVFAADSNSSDYGLQASYPYRAVLDGIRSTLQTSQFDRFRLQVSFLRRDSSDANGNLMTSDLIAFTDANADLRDDHDASIRYLDQNADGDYYDTYVSGGRTVSEQPDTHIKALTLEIFRRGRLVCAQTERVSLEQFTGDPNPSSEAALRILVSTPANSAYLYKLDTATRNGAWALPLSKAYPEDIIRYRADAALALAISGETDPLATVRFYIGGSGELANTGADAAGSFSASPPAVTAALVEGANELLAQATKDSYSSPISPRSLILDSMPPSAAASQPTGTVGTRAPYVVIAVSDPGASTTTTSGVCPDVLTLKANGVEVAHSFSSGLLVWIDSATQTVPVLATGTYAMTMEAGDYAGYKTSASWSFTLSVPDTDNSAPAIANKSPVGIAPSALPEISVRVFDNQSGIIPASVTLRLDGTVVVDSSNIGAHYDPADGTVRYTPSAAFDPSSSHAVEITASHWSTDPPDKIVSTDSWSFTVP